MPLDDFALVVGINNYAALNPLRGAEADSLDFYNWVIDPAGGKVKPANAEHIISKPHQEGSLDAEPTRSTIEKFFRRIDALANKNNKDGLGLMAGRRLWMFFSGHGFAPSYGRSALLVANTTDTAPDNFASPLWADRLFQGGWFQEVLLFQDACRERFGTGELMPPFLKIRDQPGEAYFCAMAAHDSKLSLEKPDANNAVRGVFTLTLMEALRGHARDPATGAITSDTLKSYLQNNMRAKYTPDELQNTDLSQFPDVREDIRNVPPLVIVSATEGAPAVERFPVEIALPPGNTTAAIKDSTFKVVEQYNGNGGEVWHLQLSLGFYKVTGNSGFEAMFEVAGAFNADGSKVIVHVPK